MQREKSIIVDVDGTICATKKKDELYEDVLPNFLVIDKLRYYKSLGFRIVLFTSRNMNSYEGNLGLINKHTAPVLVSWLAKWEVPYDEIYYGKPWPGHLGFYIDDRSIRPSEFLNLSLDEITNLLDTEANNDT